MAAFVEEGGDWGRLAFFTDGSAARLAAKLDARLAEGAPVLPAPADHLQALRATPLAQVKAVILGQDPYPTPGDAHGLAFSVPPGRRVPPSLANIFKELAADLSVVRPNTGSLLPWARSGVLLLNTCLTVEAGAAGCHRRLGWGRLVDEVVSAVAAVAPAAVFILWGNDARRRKPLIGAARHLVIESAHPSPLAARSGFFGSRPFSRANVWLAAQGREPVDWRLP